MVGMLENHVASWRAQLLVNQDRRENESLSENASRLGVVCRRLNARAIFQLTCFALASAEQNCAFGEVRLAAPAAVFFAAISGTASQRHIQSSASYSRIERNRSILAPGIAGSQKPNARSWQRHVKCLVRGFDLFMRMIKNRINAGLENQNHRLS